MSRDVLPILAVFALSLALLNALYIPASASHKTINVPQDYPTIQQALDAAEPGERIRVAAGMYEEHITVEKPLTLQGEGPGNTIIDGKGTRNVVTVKASNVSLSGFTVRNGSYGVYMGYSTACTLRNNHIEDNRWNLAVWGDQWQHYIHDMDSTNLVEEKPIYYWINKKDRQVPTDAGFVAIINSTNITVRNLNLPPNEQGILFVNTDKSKLANITTRGSDLGIYLLESHNNLITGNTVESVSFQGMLLRSSHNNTITRNTLRNGILGIGLQTSNNNAIYQNNFIDNKVQLGTYGSSNTWDNGMEGNYWSDYAAVDTNMDGVGEEPYNIGSNNADRYPLSGVFSNFGVSWKEEPYSVAVVSNSTISAFEFDQANKIIRFDVAGEEAIGFCRVCIPYDFMEPPYTVTVDGHSPRFINYTLYDNGTHRWLYFTYEHSIHQVEIILEFPTCASMLFILAVLSLTAIVYKRRLLKKPIH